LDLNDIKDSLRAFISQYHTRFVRITRSESQLLEIGALMIAAEHYRRQGFNVQVENKIGNRFKLKVSARGKPFNFSWYSASKDGEKVEIHGNLSVRSAYGKDGGVYVVDVGVVVADMVPKDTKGQKEWVAMRNCDLITFIEAKKLVIYPMLMAQFIGIVHEVKPTFMRRNPTFKTCHFYPALISIGYLQGISKNIRDGFRKRKYMVNVVPAFDVHVSQLARDDKATTPFEPKTSSSVEDGAGGVASSNPVANDLPF
jgi:hypothetical protein